MNKLKEKIAELRSHLNRDERGVVLLDEVTKVANQIRKDLAAAKEQEDSAKRQVMVHSDKLGEANAAIEALRASLDRERALRQQREQEVTALQDLVSSLEMQVESLMPEDLPVLERTEHSPGVQGEHVDAVLIDDLETFSAVFNQLRREMRRAPEATARVKTVLACELTDVIQSLSNGELLKLGRYVACRALMNVPCLILADHTIREVRRSKRIPDEALEPFVKWLRREIGSSGIEYVPSKRDDVVPGYHLIKPRR